MQISQRLVSSLAVVTAAAALVACAAPGPYSNQYPNTPTTSYPSNPGYAQFGRVTNVEYVRGGQSQGIAGAVVGVVGGALIGRALEQNMNRGTVDHYRVTVQFDNGGTRQFDYAQAPNVQIGDRVRADGDQLYR